VVVKKSNFFTTSQPLSVGAFPDKHLSAQHLAEHMLAFEGVPRDSQQQERTAMKRSELIDAMASGFDSLNERDVHPPLTQCCGR
jgi:hypothetical protein